MKKINAALTVFAVFGVVVTLAFLIEDQRDRSRTVVCRTFTADGCDYLLPEGSDTLTHRADCRNPLHWEHVLSDTTWWKNIRPERDSN